MNMSLAHYETKHEDDVIATMISRFGHVRNLNIFVPNHMMNQRNDPNPRVSKFVLFIEFPVDSEQHAILRLKALSKFPRAVFTCSAETKIIGRWFMGIGYVLNSRKLFSEIFQAFGDYNIAFLAEFYGGKLQMKESIMYPGQKQGVILCYNQQEFGTVIPKTHFYYFNFNQFPREDASTATDPSTPDQSSISNLSMYSPELTPLSSIHTLLSDDVDLYFA